MTDERLNDEFERLVAEHRDALEAEIAQSGALRRVREKVLMSHSVDPLAGLHWQRVAAAVMIAGMLGGAVDLLLSEPAADPVEVAIVDTLYGFDQSGVR